MRITSGFVFALLLLGAPVYAKPKVGVKVDVEEEITNLTSSGDFSSLAGNASQTVSYLNVIVLPDAPIKGFRNDGKWCIKSQAGQRVHLVKGGEYKGLLDGDFLELEVPQLKGKPAKLAFLVFDRKWRSRMDIR